LTVRTLLKRYKNHSEFSRDLADMPNLNSSRHFRLMGLASVELLFGIPWSIYATLYLNIAVANGASESPIHPYISWESVHRRFSAVGQFPAFQWKQYPTVLMSLELNRWSKVFCAFLFFAFFGFAEEARKHYRLAYNSVARKVGASTLSAPSTSKQPVMSTSAGTMPVFISRETTFKRDTRTSFSTDLSARDVDVTFDDMKAPHLPSN
jgi:pheromone a factor receptor